MKELYHLLRTAYESLRGEGVLPLMAVSVLILFLKGRKHIFAFILSVPTGIAYALTLLTAEGAYTPGNDRAGAKKGFAVSLAAFSLAVIAIALSGGRVISSDFYGPAGNTLHIRTAYVFVCDSLLSLGEDESVIEVIAPPGLSPYLKPYSSKFMPL